MNLANEQAAGFFVPMPVSLETVLTRLDALSQKPEFALQREIGLARVLKPYLQDGISRPLAALPQETELATLWLFCDFYPEDGQLTLIEQLRDVITEHIPEDERTWLDPLKHSYIDLLELVTTPTATAFLTVRSLGDATTFTFGWPGSVDSRDTRSQALRFGPCRLGRLRPYPLCLRRQGTVRQDAGLGTADGDVVRRTRIG